MRIEALEREICLTSIKKQTKCAKMTDEADPIIKNGINGAMSSCGVGSTSSNSGGGGLAIQVSRGNAVVNLSVSGTGSSSAASSTGANSSRMQYSNSSCSGNGVVGSEGSGSLSSNQDSNVPAGHTTSGGGNSNAIEAARSPGAVIGGRLQFFKDGKFILELARSREGERTGWVSVPRKTYWPPSAANAPNANTTYPKNESSTSLSFSDDNSSIQSSPWQRDHCWKQTTPRRGISKEMCVFFKRTRKFTLSHDGYKTAQLKRRRPHDNSICKIPFTLVRNGFIKSEPMDTTEIKKETLDDDRDGRDGLEDKDQASVDDVAAVKIEKATKHEDSKTSSSSTSSTTSTTKSKQPKAGRAKLNAILDKLIEQLPTGPPYYVTKVNAPTGILNHFSTSVRISDLHHNHQQHVSPRKRILRELEKVSLEDNSTKRSRAKTNAINSLPPSSPSSSSTTNAAATQNSTTAASTSSSHRSAFSNNSHISNGNTNGTAAESNSNSTNNSNRLYSSYSIHSLLGNTSSSTSSSKPNESSKESSDPSCLQAMLTSPNSSESYYASRNAYTTGSSGKRKSPNYAVTPEHNRRSSRESPNNYGPNYPSESSLSPDPVSRYKSSTGTLPPTSFHPYLSSPKYSSSTVSPNQLNDNYKQKPPSAVGYSSSSGSPSHSQVSSSKLATSSSTTTSSSSSSSSSNRSSIVYSQQSPLSNKTSNLNHHNNNNNNSNSRLREQSPVGNLSPSSSSSTPDRRDIGGGGGSTPRTVPKKTVAFRQQFSSPTSSSSSPSIVHSNESAIYKSPSSSSSDHHQKHRKNLDDSRSLSSPESKAAAAAAAAAAYQSTLDQLDRAGSLMRASPVLPPSSYYYFHPPHGTPGQHSGQPPYIPPLSPYYPLSPYAAAVAALRNPLWMHYQTAGLLSGPPPPPSSSSASSRLSFPYNGESSGLGPPAPPPPPPSQPPGLTAMHLASGPIAAAWPSLNVVQSSATDDPVSLVNVKDEHNSDVPLNLSKH